MAPNGDGIDDLANWVMQDTEPVECFGPTGTVVFWHVMILHAAGLNRVPGSIRQSVLYDFKLTPAAVEQLARHHRAPARPVGDLGPDDEAATLWGGWDSITPAMLRRPPPGRCLDPDHGPVLHPEWEAERQQPPYQQAKL